MAPANGGHLLSEEEFQEFLSWKASHVIDRVVDEVLEETATKVMEEEEGSLDVAYENPVDVDSVSQGKEGGKAVMEVEVTQVGMLEGGSEVCANLEGVKHCMLKAPEELADAKLMGAALISEVVNSLTRASPRLAEVTAGHTLLKAERMVKSRNLERTKGNISLDPSCSLPFQVL